SMNAEGEVLEMPNAKGELSVQVGSMRLRVPASECLYPARTTAPKKQKSHKKYTMKPTTAPLEGQNAKQFVAVQTASNTCDLRGQRVDEALDAAEAFLDQAYRQEMAAVYIIHGHGTGALKQAIRELCQRSSYVMEYRPGNAREGGDGVTVLQLLP
ncbi:MAG: Smr/MutS family protein, partial [Myxococcota bacterium]